MKTPTEILSTTNSGGSGIDSIRSSAILKEVPISIDDIDAEDVIFYAKLIGIDPFLENHLLWIAAAGLVSPLPVGWIAVEDHKKRLYYFDLTTGKSSWEHPNDHQYKLLVQKYRKRSQKEKLKKSSRQSSSFPSPSHSLTNQTTMSNSMGNLHFFDDDDEDEFKDLLKPKADATLSIKSSNKSSETSSKTPSKAVPTKEDSVESVEFDLENSNELIEEEGDSIASLEAFQSDNRKTDATKVSPSQSTGEKLLPKDDDKKDLKTFRFASVSGREDSDPESDHWNSLPDNEQDPFQDLFLKGAEKEKSDASNQRPMSAKVRPSFVESAQETVPANRGNLKKHLSILEEEDDGDIEEVFEDEDIEEVNELDEEVDSLKKEEVTVDATNGRFDKLPPVPKVTFSAKSPSTQMSQMGDIKPSGFAHSTPSTRMEKSVKINELNISTGASVNSALNAQQTEKSNGEISIIPLNTLLKPELNNGSSVEAYEDDFESETDNSPAKEVDFLKFEELGKKLEEQIAKLRAELKLELNDSKNDLSAHLKENIEELTKKVGNDNSEIRFITERIDKLWSSLKDIEKANQTNLNDDALDEKFEKLKENLLNLTGKKMSQLEDKLSSRQAEESQKFLEQSKDAVMQFKDEIAGTIGQVKRMTRENAASIELLREDLREQQEQHKKDVRLLQHDSQQIQELHASMREEMEQRIEKRLSQELTRSHTLMQSIGESTSAEKIQVEQLNARLDKVQERIDQVSREIDAKLEQMEAKRNTEPSLPHLHLSAKSASQKIARKVDSRRHSLNHTTSDISETEMTEEQEPKHDQEMGSGRVTVNTNINEGKNELEESKINEAKMPLNEYKINNSSKPRPTLNGNPIISSTLSQCRELQKTLHYCAKQLTDTIKQLNLASERKDADHESSVNEARHYKRPSHHSSQKKKNKSRDKMSRSQEDILSAGGEANHSEGAVDSSSSIDRRANYRFRVHESMKSSNKRISQSTPNLQGHTCHCQHYAPKSLTNAYKFKLDIEPDPYSIQMPTQRMHHHSARAERKIRSIKSSSNSLIQQVKQTSKQLRQELSSLQSLNESKTSMFGPSELVILNKTVGKQFKEDLENQPRIYFEDAVKHSDEDLIRQLRSIRNTVNERLQKMALVIEQQKTTQI